MDITNTTEQNELEFAHNALMRHMTAVAVGEAAEFAQREIAANPEAYTDEVRVSTDRLIEDSRRDAVSALADWNSVSDAAREAAVA